MIPLLGKKRSPNNANQNDTSFNVNSTRTNSKYFRAFCIGTVILFIVAISIISYFNFGTKINLHNSNPAKSLYKNAPNLKSAQASNPLTNGPSEYYKASGYDDEILALPNLDTSTCSQSVTNCDFKQYSGYLLANNDNEIHYWFIESDTADNKYDKPLFFWTNGGPGCSGMDGLLTEHGPWKVMPDLSLAYNPYTWIKEVNMVYLEQPYGVGFSVAVDGNVVAGDLNAAADMDAVIRNFLVKFPEYQNSVVYLSSESWGGHYVPMTAYTILQNNDAGFSPQINFGGFLLGNPYTDWYENTYGFVGDINGHGLMLGHDWDEWRSVCWNNPENLDNNPVCSAIYSRAYISSANANVYALDWPQCVYDEEWSDIKTDQISMSQWTHQKRAPLHEHAVRYMSNVLNHPNYDELDMRIEKDKFTEIYDNLISKKSFLKNNLRRLSTDSTPEIIGSDYEPCIEYAMTDYLNLAQVQTALNVKTTEWGLCNNAVWDAWPMSDYDRYMQEYYDKIISEYSVNLHLKLCVYSGDDDSVCGLQGTQYWMDRWEGYEPDPSINWVEWEDGNAQLGGYHTRFMDANNNIALHFMTIRTAGHMVPTTEPERALELLQRYLYVFDSS